MRLVYVLVVLVAAADQAIKFGIQRFLLENQRIPVIPGVLSVTHVLNPGASFGILQGHTRLILFMTVVLFALFFFFRKTIQEQPFLFQLGLGLGLGGALGNFIDRLRLGKVIDFLALEFWPFHNWPVFNLADAAITTGAVLIIAFLIVFETRTACRSMQPRATTPANPGEDDYKSAREE
ncbi:MAG: signal peptidase II [Clostridia bacterium]|nr:signal peptidase II [Clostridia bacterium]